MEKTKLVTLTYWANAIAMFKHSSWTMSYIMEGAPPEFDINSLTTNLDGIDAVLAIGWPLAQVAWWLLWGALFSAVIDVTMFAISRSLQEEQTAIGWGSVAKLSTYAVVMLASGFTQVFYAMHHSAPVQIVETDLVALQPGGWIAGLLDWVIVFLPLTPAFISFMFTMSIRSDGQKQISYTKTAQGKMYNIKEAKVYLETLGKRVGEPMIRSKCTSGHFGIKVNNQWQIAEKDLTEYAKQ
jgi:hypothetical protein